MSAQKTKSLYLPLGKKDVLSLHVGDAVTLSGRLVTGRDRVHNYLFHRKPDPSRLPFDLRGTVLYHCGPIMKKEAGGYSFVAGGPTTSMRVEMYEDRIISEYGIRGIMGKGGMGEKTLRAMKESGCVYLHTMGGAAAYLADRVIKVAGVWMLDEFGTTEAMWALDVQDFPAIVTMDAHGKSFHGRIMERSKEELKKLIR